ncbi:MAG TPA: PAS domain S-box protein [Rectinemataceae bacterium]|nr:PAS domain S-box protein [Rectinemataceae bacterium]
MSDPARGILLVEDEAIIALREASQLSRAGYRVIQAASGEEAVEIVTADPDSISLILMDIDLGSGMDGTEAARRILRVHDIPVLFLSAHMEPEIVSKTEQITNYGYVVKSSVFTVLDASIKMAFKLFEAQKRINTINMEFEATNEELRVSLESLQRSTEALSLSEDKFSKAFHLNPDAININRLSDGLYVDINEGFSQLMGYSREDVLGRRSTPGDLGIWVRAEDRQLLVNGLRDKGEVANFEAEFRKKDGSTGVGLMSARVIEIAGEPHIISITREITAWKRLQAELSEAQGKFRTAFENSPIGVSLTEVDGRLLMVNQAYCDFLGYRMEEINGSTYVDLTHPDDKDKSIREVQRLLDGEQESIRIEKRYLHKDGHTLWADVRVALVRDGSGDPVFFITHVADITAAKAARDELQLKSILLDNAADEIQALDLEGTIVYVNEAVCAHTGYSRLELLGQPITILDTPENRARSKPILADVIARGSARFRTRQRRKDGTVFPIEVNCVLEPTTRRYILSVVRDMTEELQAAEALRESDSRFRNLIMNAPKAMLVVHQAKTIYANNKFLELFRYSSVEETMGRPLSDYFSPTSRPHYFERRTLRESGVAVPTEYEAVGLRADGTEFPMHISYSRIETPDGSAYLGIALDISAEKCALESLREALSLKEYLLKELEHRVKNSLSITSSLISLARDEVTDATALNVLQDTASRIRSIATVYEHLYQTGAVQSTELGAYVRSLATSILESYARPGKNITLDVAADQVELDSKRTISLGLIVNELLTNAVKHAFPDTGEGSIAVRLEKNADSVRLSVSDTGIGFDGLNRERGISSMGIMLIEELTKQIGGTLILESRTGTRAEVTFPLTERS